MYMISHQFGVKLLKKALFFLMNEDRFSANFFLIFDIFSATLSFKLTSQRTREFRWLFMKTSLLKDDLFFDVSNVHISCYQR